MENPQTESYTLHEVLGEGSCGRVYRCTTPAGEVRAVKVLTAMAINRDLVRYSLRKLSELPPHPGLVMVHHHELSETPYHYVMDLHADCVSSGDEEEVWRPRRLDSLFGGIDQDEEWRLVEQLAETLAYLHDYDLFHCGLKPSNILFTQGEAGYQTKIGDLGQGWVSGAHYLELNDIPYYASPEQLRTAEFLDGHGKQWDVYSFGVIAYQLLNGHVPRLQEWFARETSGEGSGEDLQLGVVEHSPPEYADQIDVEREIAWHAAPRDASEERRFEILSRCLAVDPMERYRDMLQVVEAFRSESLAEEVNERPIPAVRTKSRLLAPVRMMGPLATTLAAVLMVAGITILVTQLMLKQARQELSGAREELRESVAVRSLEISAATRELREAEGKVAKSESREQAARSQLAVVQEFGDDFFSLARRYRGVDSPEFQKERRAALGRAREYYESFIATNEGNPDLFEMSVGARQYLVEILKEMGSREEVRDALVVLGQGIEKLLLQQPGDVHWRSELAVSQRELAELLLEEGLVSEARELAEESLEAMKKLSEEDPGSKERWTDHALGLVAWGKVEQEDKKLAEAVESLTRAVDMLLPLHEEVPEDPYYRLHLAGAFSLIGDLMQGLHDLEGGIEMHEKAVVLLAQLVRESPDVEEYNRRLAHSFLRLGELTGSIKQGQDALTLLERLQEASPEDEQVRCELASCYGVLGSLQRDQGQAKNAKELQDKSLSMLEELVKAAPHVQEYRFHYADCLYRQANLSEDAGNFDQSLEYLTSALNVVDELSKKNPKSIRYQRKLAELRGSIGFANERAGNKEKAKEVYAAAVHQWERLASLLPEDDIVERGLSWSRRQLAALGR